MTGLGATAGCQSEAGRHELGQACLLGHRCPAEDPVGLQRLLGRDVRVAVHVLEDDLAAAADEDGVARLGEGAESGAQAQRSGTRRPHVAPVIDKRSRDGLDAIEPLRAHADILGGRTRQLLVGLHLQVSSRRVRTSTPRSSAGGAAGQARLNHDFVSMHCDRKGAAAPAPAAITSDEHKHNAALANPETNYSCTGAG